MTTVLYQARSYWDTTVHWWNRQDQGVHAKIILVGTTLGAILVGGPVFQYTMVALVTNALFWWEFKDSPRIMAFLCRWGRHLDITISILSIFAGGLTLGGFLTGLMFGSYFTLFRQWLLPRWAAAHPEYINVKKVEPKALGGAQWQPA